VRSLWRTAIRRKKIEKITKWIGTYLQKRRNTKNKSSLILKL
jgi:hypothetical protein